METLEKAASVETLSEMKSQMLEAAVTRSEVVVMMTTMIMMMMLDQMLQKK